MTYTKKQYVSPTTECVELKISNAILQGSTLDGTAYRSGYGDAEELEW
jgi:hypothetical protein